MIRTTLSICALFGCMVLLTGLIAKSSAPVHVSETDASPAEIRQARPPVKPEQSGKQAGMVLPEAVASVRTLAAVDEEQCAIPAGHVVTVAAEEEAETLISVEKTPVDAAEDLPANPIRSGSPASTKTGATSSRRSEQMVALRGGRRSNPSDSEKKKDSVDRGPGGNAPFDPKQETGPKPSLSEDSSLSVEEEEQAKQEMEAEEAASDEEKLKSEPANKEADEEKSADDEAAKTEEKTESDDAKKEPQSKKAEESEEESPSPLQPVGPEKPELKSASEPEPLTAELVELQDRLHDALAYYYQRPENVATRSPWGAMHAMIAYGVDSDLIAGNRKVNAIGWLCYNGTCNGQRLFYTDRGQLVAQIGPGVQGHAGQFLSMLAQSRVKTDYPIRVDGQDFTVASLIEYEKLTCKPKTELTFKLIALSHYLKSDEQWKSQDLQDWSVSRLIKEELAQPIVGAACGGTHRLTGLSYAVKKRKQRGEPIEGQWLRADKFIQDFHAYTFGLQNPDGSCSTEWFKGRGNDGPPSRRLETTGHVTEWLAFSLSDAELRDPKMVKSVTYLTNLLLDGRNEKWSIGPLGHGLHALAIYDERVFGNKPGTRKLELAGRRVMPQQPVKRY